METLLIVALTVAAVMSIAAVAAMLRLRRRPCEDAFQRIRSERDEALTAKGLPEDANGRLESEQRSFAAQRDTAVHDLDAARRLHETTTEAQSRRMEETRSECDTGPPS